MKNTSQRGDTAVLLAASKLVEAGLTVLRPMSECLKFDLGIYDEHFYKVQIKRAYPAASQGKYLISARSVVYTTAGAIARKYTENDIDFIIGVVIDTNDIYCIPAIVAANRNVFTLNPSNIESVYATATKHDVEVYKYIITLHNKIYKV